MARSSTKKTVTDTVSKADDKVVVAKNATVAEDEAQEIKEPEKIEEPKTVRKISGDDLIPCRSVTSGELICNATRDGETYHWMGYGDVKEVTFSDLSSLRAKRSAFIYDPLFVIEDEDVLEQPRWKDVKELYEKMYSISDINDVLEMPITKFKKVFNDLPKGLKNAIKTEIATQIEKGTFDSIQKVRYVDEVCGTDLKCLL